MVLNLFNIPEEPGFMEGSVQDFTHAHFPRERFDEVILDGRRLRAFNSPRLQRFLALIALRRDLQHRSRLAFELWPDSDERQARTNLRKLLHEFRQALPDIDASGFVSRLLSGRLSFIELPLPKLAGLIRWKPETPRLRAEDITLADDMYQDTFIGLR